VLGGGREREGGAAGLKKETLPICFAGTGSPVVAYDLPPGHEGIFHVL